MTWARKAFFKSNEPWLDFAKSSKVRMYFRAQRFVMFMNKPNPPISVSLGSREADIPYFAKALNSTSFHDFYLRGFITRDDLLQLSKLDDWLPLVAKSVKKSYDRGGTIYYHLDLLTDFKALYDRKSPNHKGGSITELRYLIDNGLCDKGVVHFRLGYNPLPANKAKDLNDAINKYKKFVAKDPDKRSFRGKFNIYFK
ncbi:hypothetical protein [uncultured Microscilla sp.]|uniref:hypothetical protein n=1 Tax=uncultured Microscilla sp. TaxID=432653 RepID=UPI002620A637|nr:hypothetical protein [uncultured Microscilla sp.]